MKLFQGTLSNPGKADLIAELCILSMFLSGRNITISPSADRYAFIPSNNSTA